MRKYLNNIILLIIIFNVSISTISAHANYNEEVLFEPKDSNNIIRVDTVTYIMYSIGFDINYPSFRESYGSFHPIPCDYFHINVPVDQLFHFERNTNFQFVEQGEQLILAIELGVLRGCGKCEQHPQDIRTQKFKSTTVNEALAFMVRCLEEKSDKLLDLDYVMEVAGERGLILETDPFYNDVNKPLSFDEFRTLLSRFMNQKVYLQADFIGDITRSSEDFTYYELLESKYGKGYPDRVLALKGYDWINDYFEG